jgi:8-oxo-dGTP pyrophosphatase MutT (NUDIX family)
MIILNLQEQAKTPLLRPAAGDAAIGIAFIGGHMDQREQIIARYMGKAVHVVVDRPIGYVHGDLVYPINYGYIPGLMAADGEEQDAYILGVTEPLQAFDGWVVGVVRRKNDVEDKLVVAPLGQAYHQGQIAEAVTFQERFFDTQIQACLEKSCGVLPYRVEQGQRQFLLVFESFSKCWSLPKGHMEAGETEPQTALRELWEETGLTATLDTSRSAAIEYPISKFARKQVVFFLGQVSGETRTRPGEIETYKWVTADELQDYLFPDTVDACRKLLK